MSLDRLPKPYLVKRIILSENYDEKTNDQDIALLKLSSPVAFNGQSVILFSYLRLWSESNQYPFNCYGGNLN